MSIIYRGSIPERNYSLLDFNKKNIILSWCSKWYDEYNKHHCIRAVFRSNGLLGEIRTCSYGNTYAIDVWSGWHSSERTCLGTEFKSVREAKSVLYKWFESKGFVVAQRITNNDWSKATLSFTGVSVPMFPITYK